MSHASHPHVRIGQNSSVQAQGNTSKRQHSRVPAWRRCLIGALPPLIALALSMALVIPASASATVFKLQERVAFPSQPVFNPCLGEDVMLSGDGHLEVNEVLNGDLFTRVGEMIHLHVNEHLTGTDDHGTVWISNGSDELQTSLHAVANADGTVALHQEASEPTTLQFVSQGSSPNFFAHFTLHATLSGTVDADGNSVDAKITGEVIHASITCK